MTSKSIAASFMYWLKQRKEKVVVSGDYYQIVPEWYHGSWQDADKVKVIRLVGKDAMLAHMGLKK